MRAPGLLEMAWPLARRAVDLRDGHRRQSRCSARECRSCSPRALARFAHAVQSSGAADTSARFDAPIPSENAMHSSKPVPEHQPSLWQSTLAPLAKSELSSDTRAEVCVIGGGIAGLSVAYELTRAGRSVVVLESGAIGSGMTGRTTAHLVNALDDRYFEIERMLGAENARLAAASHSAAIERIGAIVGEESIDCDFERVDGFLFNPPGETSDVIEKEFEAALRAGLRVEKVGRAPLATFDTGLALRFPAQAQFHPLKYLAGLAAAIERRGGRIFTGAHVTGVQGGKAATVRTRDGHTVSAAHLVVATNTPVNDRFVIHTKQAPYTSYVVGLRVPRGAIPHVLLWDTAQDAGEQQRTGPLAYHYVRLHPMADHDVLIVGGEDHKTGQNDDFESPFRALEAWARERFPLAAAALEHRWSGQVMEPVDGMGFIGRNPRDEENVYVATGDSGNGMTHGAIAGMLIRDFVLGQRNAWAALYDPGRITMKAAPEFVHENANVAAQFCDYVTSGDVASEEEVARGCGALVRDGASKRAVFRDETGVLHRFSAVCPHLGCIVHWNSAEHTWDCPCHGSRFEACGHVITGPASGNLGAS